MLAGLRRVALTPARLGAARARRDLIARRVATCLTVITATLSVLIAAVVSVAFAIT
jgi:hypothetical protein